MLIHIRMLISFAVFSPPSRKSRLRLIIIKLKKEARKAAKTKKKQQNKRTAERRLQPRTCFFLTTRYHNITPRHELKIYSGIEFTSSQMLIIKYNYDENFPFAVMNV